MQIMKKVSFNKLFPAFLAACSLILTILSMTLLSNWLFMLVFGFATAVLTIMSIEAK